MKDWSLLSLGALLLHLFYSIIYHTYYTQMSKISMIRDFRTFASLFTWSIWCHPTARHKANKNITPRNRPGRTREETCEKNMVQRCNCCTIMEEISCVDTCKSQSILLHRARTPRLLGNLLCLNFRSGEIWRNQRCSSQCHVETTPKRLVALWPTDPHLTTDGSPTRGFRHRISQP